MRVLGIDFGSKRIGIAISNSERTLATPYETICRSGSAQTDYQRIGALAEEAGVTQLVVGLPLHLDGSMSPNAEQYSEEAKLLSNTVGLPAATYDERLTTVTAQESMKMMKLSPKRKKAIVDQLAASVMLQSWLDHERHLASVETVES